ncbi:hypothetical protein RKD45_005323 [Streptomyces griseus]
MAQPQVYAVGGVQRGEQFRHHGSELGEHGSGPGAGQGDVEAHGAGGGGDLAAEHPLSDHDEPPRGQQSGAQREGVVERPQDVHALGVGAGEGPRP